MTRRRFVQPFRVLIVGDHPEEEPVSCSLGRLWSEHGRRLVVIEGDRTPADKMAATWAEMWSKKGAYHLRMRPTLSEYLPDGRQHQVRRMIEQGRPDLILMFPGSHDEAALTSVGVEYEVPIIDPLPDRRRTKEDPGEVVAQLRAAISKLQEELTSTEDELIRTLRTVQAIDTYVERSSTVGDADRTALTSIITRSADLSLLPDVPQVEHRRQRIGQY